MKAFVGHSFQDKDAQLVDKIIKFLGSTGLECQTGESAQNRSVAEKVKERIRTNDIFVGIFTCDKEINVKKHWFSRRSKGKRIFTTSKWVIQESGFAIGSGRELIFLVEEEIKDIFPELQGDLELIYFKRHRLEGLFLKLNQMVESIRSKETIAKPGEVRDRPEEIEKPEFETQRQEVEKGKGDKEKALELLLEALNEENAAKIQQVYTKELEPVLKEEEKLLWKAAVLRLAHKYGDSEAFHRLTKFSEENPDNPDIIHQLALRYKEMGEYTKAKDKFLAEKDLYNIKKANEKKKIIDCYEEASLCLVSDGKYEEATELLTNLLANDDYKENKAEILVALANIAKEKKDYDRFFIYAEGSLEINPSDTSLRFDLAYRYSEKDNKLLSLLHYKKLTNTTKSPAGLNNLGVECQTLKLPAKSISSFATAASYKNTLAMSNIADRYLDEGFIEDAEEEINKANELVKEGIEVHGNVGLAQNRLNKMLDDEETKEKEILAEAEKERKFRVRYSEAFYCGTSVAKEKLEDSWKTPWGDLRIVFDDVTHTFQVDETKQIKSGNLLSLSMRKSDSKEEDYKIRLIKIEGKVENLSGRYKIEIEEKLEHGIFGPTTTKIYEADGYMIINQDCITIEVMEKTKDGKLDLHVWKKVGKK
ncbi:MAG: hypothetical protein ABII96_00885 [Candidatus Zixiibacteriota bacterium]